MPGAPPGPPPSSAVARVPPRFMATNGRVEAAGCEKIASPVGGQEVGHPEIAMDIRTAFPTVWKCGNRTSATTAIEIRMRRLRRGWVGPGETDTEKGWYITQIIGDA